MQNFIIRITQKKFNLIAETVCQCFILPTISAADFTLEFVQKVHTAGKLVLAQGDDAVTFYQEYGLDGVLIDTVKEAAPQKMIEQVQKQIPQAVLGVISRNRRHEAMLVSECEPDFVAFKVWNEGIEQTKELLEWYNELFLIQSAAQIEDEAVDIAELTADFVIVDDVKFEANHAL